MQLLVNVIYNIARHSKGLMKNKEFSINLSAPSMDKESEQKGNDSNKFRLNTGLVNKLCNCLSQEIVDDTLVFKLATTISWLCFDQFNFTLFIKELANLITDYSKESNEMINNNLKLIQDSKEVDGESKSGGTISVTKIGSVDRDKVQIDLLNEIESASDYNGKLQKILNIVEQLFEKALIETAKRRKGKSQEIKEMSANKMQNGDFIDSESREEVKSAFRDLFDNKELNSLWINVTEFLSLLNEIFATNSAVLGPLSHRLQPILESFFIIYKILNDDEAYEFHKKGKFLKVKDTKKSNQNLAISKIVSDGEVPN
mmetsp:Transcript_7014/g.6235  ORF Transcript_7014/g.6235 Transcript_7014/m.6235 type:complete len:315 (+) Transcript_7014:2386-3330(+)